MYSFPHLSHIYNAINEGCVCTGEGFMEGCVMKDVFVSLHMERHLRHSASQLGGPSHSTVMRTLYVEFWQLKECVCRLLCGLHKRDS